MTNTQFDFNNAITDLITIHKPVSPLSDDKNWTWIKNPTKRRQSDILKTFKKELLALKNSPEDSYTHALYMKLMEYDYYKD